MGHSSKKKKRGGGGGARRIKKDHNSHGGDINDLLTEEITALRAIFQEDCKVVSDSPPIIKIKLRPYSKDAGYEDLDVSALLSVRCLPGYPYKCPKLQITLENGLSKADAENLLSLLNDQASQQSNAPNLAGFAYIRIMDNYSMACNLGYANFPLVLPRYAY
ncbi:protein kinase family protein [Actinidia rufa]|uniref:Protein kinase family protein n=1 Tax=Actinidia rufa TaxID=165716 RepID=A0A7J0E881_9ERIC|nr:protein kinase family protein [Actinidia rufa]